MARIVGRHGCLVLLVLGLLLLIGPLPIQARVLTPANLPAQCFALEAAQDNLTTAQLSATFDTVISPSGSYQNYTFPLDVRDTPPGLLMPVLARSVGGIESDWTQFADGQTLVNVNYTNDPAKDSCDYGLMQVNSQNDTLFDSTPSLRGYTAGNIAAGATLLAQWWNYGIPTADGPSVNDLDPQRLINWYYALSNYNGAPGDTVWVNNPNCGQPDLIDICGEDNDFRQSRDFNNGTTTANWNTLDAGNYPYQERVLYNLAYPRYPANQAVQWRAGHLGLLERTSADNYGIRPDDAIFLRNGASFSPNILLFQHRATPVRASTQPQTITFEYDLPLAARVTINVINPGKPPQRIAIANSPAGWTRLVASTQTTTQTVPIQAGAVYRITAERGDLSNTATYWIGQYQRAFTLRVSDPSPTAHPFRVALPLMTRSLPPSEVWNGDFRQRSWLPISANEVMPPAYWDVQTSFSTQDGAYNLRASDVLRRIADESDDDWMRFQGVPGARADLSQRVNVDRQGDYRLTFTIDIPEVLADSTTSLEVRVRPVRTGGVTWSSLRVFTAADAGMDNETVSLLVPDVRDPVIISFLATFDPQDGARDANGNSISTASKFYISDVSFTYEP